jgi:molybdate transport system ATP-binding protein
MPRRSSPLVTLDHAYVVLAGAPVLLDVSLTLHAGEGLAVLGPNGSGKSTLLRLLRGDVWPAPETAPKPWAAPPPGPDLAARGGGSRLFHGPDGAFPSPIGMRERLALVAPEVQDAYVRRDWDLPVEAVIRSGFHDALWPPQAATAAEAARVAEAATELGISHLLGRSFLELSRGEGRRVLLARALVTRPAALLLDEACDGLDPAAREALLERVASALRGGTAVVMATHRPEELVPGIDRVLRLEGGRIREDGPRRNLPPPSPAPTPEATPARRAPLPGPVRFELSGTTVLRDGQAVLSDLDWTVRAGERWSIVGRNGAGKSTLLRLLAGEEQPSRGRVDRLGLGPRAGADERRGRIALVSPELQARHRLDATGEEVILSGFAGTVGLAVPPSASQRARAAAAAERLGIRDLAGRRLLSLSYGELRKLLLARALAPGPEALLLDEPLAGLDPGSRAWVLAALEELGPDGPVLVSVSHHLDELPRGGNRLRLDGGRLVREE